MKFRSLLILGTIAAAFALSLGCSKSNDNKTPTAAAGATSTGAGGDIPETKIGAKEYAYDSPDTIAGGLIKLTLTNNGKEPHQAQIVRLNDGVTPQQFQSSLQSPDPAALLKLVTTMGGPNVIDPGNSQSVIDTLTPGNYALLCFVSGDDNIPHLAKGMVKTFTVTAPPAAQPSPPVTSNKLITADFNFLGVDTLPTGNQTIEVTNGGPQPHEVTMIRLKNGVTVDQIKTILASSEPPPPGPPPFDDVGGLGAQNAGGKGYIQTNLTAGSYAFLCFVPDAATGKPHAELGMVRGLTVK
jgi:hypothetical protein